MKYCRNCGKELNSDIQYCPNCGASVSEEQSGNCTLIPDSPVTKIIEVIAIFLDLA